MKISNRIKPLGSMVLFLTLTLSLFNPPEASTAVVTQQWDGTVSYRTDDAGDILSVCAMFVDSAGIYLYDRASGAILIYSLDSKLIRTVALESIGRGSYVGDDFIIFQEKAIFINSVDHRLEMFDISTGTHTRSISTRDLLTGATRMSRLIDRITLNDQTVYVGNAHTLIPFDLHLAKRSSPQKSYAPGRHERLLLLHDNQTVTLNKRTKRIRRGRKSFQMVESPVPLSGKQYGVVSDTLYGLVVGKKGFTILELVEDVK